MRRNTIPKVKKSLALVQLGTMQYCTLALTSFSRRKNVLFFWERDKTLKENKDFWFILGLKSEILSNIFLIAFERSLEKLYNCAPCRDI